jgi:RNA polymerase sigma factor (sigma-70 family)
VLAGRHAPAISGSPGSPWTGEPAVKKAARIDTKAAADAQYARFFGDEFQAVTRLIHSILRDVGRAEEIAQDAFLQLLLHWDKVSRYERPDAWVRRVAIRLAMRSMRRERMLGVLILSLPRPIEPSPRDLDVSDAIGRLPGSQRAAVVLFYLEDRPASEIAHILGCSEATARVHLHRGRKRLAALLGQPGYVDG